MPYRFLEELATADVAFEAWGKTAEELFIAAAGALLATMVADPQRVQRQRDVSIRLTHEEFDLLLFDFLQELVFYKDARRLLLHASRVSIDERKGLFCLEAVASGEEIAVERHRLLVDVKAVTLHKFQVLRGEHDYRATVVLDV